MPIAGAWRWDGLVAGLRFGGGGGRCCLVARSGAWWVSLGAGGMEVPSSLTPGTASGGSSCFKLRSVVGMACGGFSLQWGRLSQQRDHCCCVGQLLLVCLEIGCELFDIVLEITDGL